MKGESAHGCRGITLIELMITLVIGVILLAIAVPNFGDFIMRSRMTSQINEFVATLRLAREEAIKRGRTVHVCVETNPATLACAGTDWALGWKIWSDDDGDDTVDDGEVILIHGAIAADILVTASGFTDNAAIQFNRDGTSDSAGTFTFCDSRGASAARAVLVTETGQPRLSRVNAERDPLSCG